MDRSVAASTLAPAALLSLLWVAAPVRAEPAASPTPAASFDLVELVDADPKPPAGAQAVLRGAHKQTRTSVQTRLGSTIAYPVTIPPDSFLSLGFTLSAAPFMVESPELAEPARFQVVFTENGGQEHVLLERRVDSRNNAADRRWFDERIDLSALAGKQGTLAFATINEGDAGKGKQSTIYWSTPRIVTAPRAEDVSLLFITIDCLRADHLGSHGYARATTPNLDRLAAEGVRFAHAYSNAPMTLPSIPQIFTSRVFPTRDHPILTDPIARAGIPSAAFVNNAWIPLWLSQGGHAEPPGTFDRMVSGELDARAITDLAIGWIDDHSKDRFALYLHYLDAHTPYRPPAKYIEMFADPAYKGPVGETFNDSEGADAGKYDEADRKKIVALYDASIRYVDDEIGRLLESLRKSGRLDRTLVVISADHGEEFWEHGRFFHGQSLYDELLHVPLLVRFPRGERAGTVIEPAVRSIDIAPSILDWLELEAPPSFSGRTLAEVIESPKGDGDVLVATATQAQFPTRYAIRTRTTKLIENLDTGRSEVYDVAADPGERKDLSEAAPEASAALAERLADAREVLRRQGYQMQIVGPQAGKVEVSARLESHPKSGTFLTLDRRGGGEPKPRLAIGTDGLSLTAQGSVSAAGTGFRFDRLPDPRNLGNKDLVKLTVEVDGQALSRDQIALGAQAKKPTSDLIDVRDRTLEATEEPLCPPPAQGARVCLWRFPGEEIAPLPEIKDPKVREKLRALGYLQ